MSAKVLVECSGVLPFNLFLSLLVKLDWTVSNILKDFMKSLAAVPNKEGEIYS
jgi:hypothetical protein